MIPMTERHNLILDGQIKDAEATLSFNRAQALREIAANIRSQVSGETVNVPRSELEALIEDASSYHSRPTRSSQADCVRRVTKNLRRWLTPAPKGETK